MLPFSVSLLILVVALAMVVGKVSSQPTKLQVIIKESNKNGERPRNKDTVMLTNSRLRTWCGACDKKMPADR